MSRCLLTYALLKPEEKFYSARALKKMSPHLSALDVFPYSAAQQRREAQRLATKMSIQGMQPKISVILEPSKHRFTIVDYGGQFIIKPQTPDYPELPENEDVTMHLAELAGFNVPWHGLLQCEDGQRSYVVKRFDRRGRTKKVPQEDFGQLIGATRATKYLATTERAIEVIAEFCTFPQIENFKFYQLMIFSFLVGNEDLHIKNLSLITEPNKVRLSPVYDLVNSTIALAAPKEELALELKNKKSGFVRTDFTDYLGQEQLFLPEKKVNQELDRLLAQIPQWQNFIDHSFLSIAAKKAYKDLLSSRAARLSG
jgi:serine/threonine-protein kinase HipA